MRRDSTLAQDMPAVTVPRAAAERATPTLSRPRVVLLQTQAEGAGAQEIARILGNGLDDRGYDAHLVFFFRRTAAYDKQPKTFFCASQRPAGLLDLVRMFTTLVRHLKQLQPDAVLCFQHYGNIIGAAAAWLAGARVIIANRTSAKSLEPRWAQWLDLVFGTTGLFRRVVVNSKAIADEYRSHPHRYQSRVVRIDHGFETKTTGRSKREARAFFGLPVGACLLGSVARLHPAKNLGAAIRLLNANHYWHLAIAGQGAEREHLNDLARTLGVFDRVHFVGELPPERIGTFLQALDIFVFPSLAETFGLAVVEAAQAGVPVVANDLEVLKEVLAVDGAPCALFADVGDTTAFVAAIQSLLDDKELCTALTSRAAGLAERYSLEAMVSGYAALLEESKHGGSASPTR
jgi:glycosyltransferase involved in cell wall biosynthesis